MSYYENDEPGEPADYYPDADDDLDDEDPRFAADAADDEREWDQDDPYDRDSPDPEPPDGYYDTPELIKARKLRQGDFVIMDGHDGELEVMGRPVKRDGMWTIPTAHHLHDPDTGRAVQIPLTLYVPKGGTVAVRERPATVAYFVTSFAVDLGGPGGMHASGAFCQVSMLTTGAMTDGVYRREMNTRLTIAAPDEAIRKFFAADGPGATSMRFIGSMPPAHLYLFEMDPAAPMYPGRVSLDLTEFTVIPGRQVVDPDTILIYEVVTRIPDGPEDGHWPLALRFGIGPAADRAIPSPMTGPVFHAPDIAAPRFVPGTRSPSTSTPEPASNAPSVLTFHVGTCVCDGQQEHLLADHDEISAWLELHPTPDPDPDTAPADPTTGAVAAAADVHHSHITPRSSDDGALSYAAGCSCEPGKTHLLHDDDQVQEFLEVHAAVPAGVAHAPRFEARHSDGQTYDAACAQRCAGGPLYWMASCPCQGGASHRVDTYVQRVLFLALHPHPRDEVTAKTVHRTSFVLRTRDETPGVAPDTYHTASCSCDGHVNVVIHDPREAAYFLAQHPGVSVGHLNAALTRLGTATQETYEALTAVALDVVPVGEEPGAVHYRADDTDHTEVLYPDGEVITVSDVVQPRDGEDS